MSMPKAAYHSTGRNEVKPNCLFGAWSFLLTRQGMGPSHLPAQEKVCGAVTERLGDGGCHTSISEVQPDDSG